ncbi:hypothetical protein HY622_02630 [Candidatus Uhrbacteria bacterium]|nr:hypothetical protein [Candidatus Uhrbacteria bacterium]
MQLIAIFYLGIVGYCIAWIVFGYRKIEAIFLAPLAVSLVITIVSAVIFLFGSFTSITIGIILASPLAVIGAALLAKKSRGAVRPENSVPVVTPKMFSLPFYGCGVSLLLSAISIVLLFAARTTATTLGPWDIVEPLFFALVAVNTGMLLIVAKDERTPIVALYAAMSAYIASITAVVAIAYPLGFGFDPILHRAAEGMIAQQGFINPRTLYYGGHYGLITTLAQTLSLASATVDRFIVPILAALSLPVLAYRSFLFGADEQKARIGTALFAIGLPIASLGSGTPWGYAILLTIVVILSSIQLQFEKNKAGTLMIGGICVLALLAVHPLAGLPVTFIAVGSVLASYGKLSVWKGISCVIAAALSLPLAFFANSLISRQLPIVFTSPDIAAIASVLWAQLAPQWEYRFHAALDLAYFFIQNSNFFLLGVGLIGAATLMLSRSVVYQRIGAVLGMGSAAMLATFIVMRISLSFPSLPQYEQMIYADRILEIMLLFLLTVSIYPLQRALQKLNLFYGRLLLFILFIFIGITAVAHVYASYPHNDAYIPYHGYTIAQTDIDAVRWINSHAGKENYIVLANQVVSAASVREFGFARYYPIQTAAGGVDQFYYPIPNGSPLSLLYQAMLAHPSRDVVERTAQLVGVSQAYFVVNRYEPRFRTIIDTAKKEANDVYVIGEDAVTVLYYKFP